jgi:hypothetical protein
MRLLYAYATLPQAYRWRDALLHVLTSDLDDADSSDPRYQSFSGKAEVVFG